MTHPRHNHGSDRYQPPSRDADVIPFRNREDIGHPEQALVQSYVQKWLEPDDRGEALALAILDDTDGALKEALQSSVLYDKYDELEEADGVIQLLVKEVIAIKGKDLPILRKAFMALLEARAVEITPDADHDIAAQLAKLPEGNEETWRKLIERVIS